MTVSPARDPRFDPPGSPVHRVEKAPLAANLLWVPAIYAGMMGFPLTLGGAMLNEMMFSAGLVHFALAGAFYAAWHGILNRKRWAKWLALGLAILGVIGPPLAILGSFLAGHFDSGMLIFPGVLTIYCAVLLWSLNRSSLVDWMARPEDVSLPFGRVNEGL